MPCDIFSIFVGAVMSSPEYDSVVLSLIVHVESFLIMALFVFACTVEESAITMAARESVFLLNILYLFILNN